MTDRLTELPADYHRGIFEVEEAHWWHVGTRHIAAGLLRSLGSPPPRRVLDAGCGTGRFLRWLAESGSVERACGIDPSADALELARRRLPGAELPPATLAGIPFESRAFDLVAVNDVLQHVPEAEMGRSVGELARVLAPGGLLLVRTNGARRARREAHDWRAYDRPSLRRALGEAGFRCERLTHVNVLPSLVAALRGSVPHAPSATGHGIPEPGGALKSLIGRACLAAEARYLARPGRSLPAGHTILAVARLPPPG